ncbi:MAG: tetratricopeptide repeat protein [Ferrovibrionaceae bacterium]
MPLQTAQALHAAGRLAEAEAAYRAVLSDDPDNAEALHGLGLIAQVTGNGEVAVRLLALAADKAPADPEPAAHLGAALLLLGRRDEAEAALLRALGQAPGHAEARFTLANLTRDRGDVAGAERAYRTVLALAPAHLGAAVNLASLLRQAFRLDASAAWIGRALILQPDNFHLHANLAALRHHQRRFADARAAFRRALAQAPTEPGIQYNYAHTLLADDDFAIGFRVYEWRWQAREFDQFRRSLPMPRWDGRQRAGQRLLIHAEQGFGDAIQFCRYVPLAAKRGQRVVFEVPAPLVRLMASLPGVEQVVARTDAVPAADCECPLLSLPLALGRPADMRAAAVPYLAPPAEVAEQWTARLAGLRGVKVGLCWAGNAFPDPTRTIPSAALEILGGLGDVTFVSLQKDGTQAPAGLNMVDMSAEIADFADTAGLMTALDLVISIDSAAVHLAGALGRPTWLLNRRAVDWRWRDKPTGVPWYPRIRQFRQPDWNDWASVLLAVRAELAALAG